MLIFKICSATDWQKAVINGAYAGSEDDLRDGFIHFSTAEQLPGTVEKHFAGQVDLIVVAFDSDDFATKLRWEPSRGGQLFPHVYGEVDVSLAKWRKALPLGDNGNVLPRLDTPNG